MAAIKFLSQINAGETQNTINHTAGSGLGFYGAGYGVSVPVGQTQDSTWVTNSNGTATNQYELWNTKNGDPSTDTGTPSSNGKVQSGGSTTKIELDHLVNYKAPLNIRFTHTEAVRVQNCKLRIFDRNNIDKHASGVVTYVYESRHPAKEVTAEGLTHRGTAGHYWSEFDSADSATPADMLCTSSPGVSGLNSTTADQSTLSKFPNNGVTTPAPTFLGTLHQSDQHDWYLGLSAQPTEIGSKTNYGLYFTLEYL